ncbi:hypothetical protein LEP3755_35300 [Leptolyngbya sp. NIES-3755]|nr:hypothetical protein LEP3755_35300 [Leptolyngbya sp. NIES-3755]
MPTLESLQRQIATAQDLQLVVKTVKQEKLTELYL